MSSEVKWIGRKLDSNSIDTQITGSDTWLSLLQNSQGEDQELEIRTEEEKDRTDRLE
jgi:hypothetical protein